jgi:hypothetical protein
MNMRNSLLMILHLSIDMIAELLSIPKLLSKDLLKIVKFNKFRFNISLPVEKKRKNYYEGK